MSHSLQPSSSNAQATLLVVDDSPQDLSLLSEFLRDARLRLVVAFDGREGYQKATVVIPDLILLDVRMPRTDGFAACRLLKADPRTRDIPVIFLSGCNELDDRLLGLRLGAVDYISKPFAPEEVLARIGVHLDLRRRLRAESESAQVAAISDESDSAPRNSTVQAAMDILMRDIGKPPSLPDLAHQVGTNERRLTELFRTATNMPVFAWLRNSVSCWLAGCLRKVIWTSSRLPITWVMAALATSPPCFVSAWALPRVIIARHSVNVR